MTKIKTHPEFGDVWTASGCPNERFVIREDPGEDRYVVTPAEIVERIHSLQEHVFKARQTNGRLAEERDQKRSKAEELKSALLRLDALTDGRSESGGSEPEWVQEIWDRFVLLKQEREESRLERRSAEEELQANNLDYIAARAKLKEDLEAAERANHKLAKALDDLLLHGHSMKVHDLAMEESWVVDDLDVVNEAVEVLAQHRRQVERTGGQP